jgi:hypothetical protein
VVDKQGIIRAADVKADYTIRLEPSETVRQLRMLTERLGGSRISEFFRSDGTRQRGKYMNVVKTNYFDAYRSLKLTRDAAGVLVAEFHTKGGPFPFTAQDHTELVDAFYRIAQDRGNKIVILTGTGGELIPGIDFSSFGNVADPGVWSQVHGEGVQILENIANIRVPVIAAVEGRAHVHSEYALLAKCDRGGGSCDLP